MSDRTVPSARRGAPASAVTPVPPRTHHQTWQRCWQGADPAEVLSSRDREDLVWHLWEAGWTDVQIALHTRMTVYTTVRIRRDRLGLDANPAIDRAAG